MRLAIVAGEMSGDLLGGGLLRALIARGGGSLRVEGIGGPEMIAAGLSELYPMERLSVMGLVEVLGRYLELVPVRARLVRRFRQARPAVFVGVDAPDFNLALERRLRAAGIPTVHYVSPSVWAWRRWRISGIRRAVDRMLVLFPFEVPFYEARGVPARFVGHPLADQIPETVDRAEARAQLGLPAAGELIGLLPGSRLTEVRALAGPFVATAGWLAARRPGLRFVVPCASAATRACFEGALRGADAALDVTVIDGRSRVAMAAADAVLLASGTASLEAMLLKRPMVITYRTNEITYRLMKAMIEGNVSWIGLPNLLAGREVAPEILQHEAVPERLGPPLLAYLAHPERVRELADEFTRQHRALRRGASARAAEAVLEVARA